MTRVDRALSFSVAGLRFRQLTAADLPMTLAWRNQERVRSQLFTTRELTLEEHQSWFAGQAGSDTDLTWICEDEQGPIGQASIYKINWEAGTAEFGRVMIGEARALGKRYGTILTLAITDCAFRKLGLKQLDLMVRVDNDAAQRCYKRAGFSIVVHPPELFSQPIVFPSPTGNKFQMVLRSGAERDWEHWDDDGVVEKILQDWSEPLEREHRRWLAQQIIRMGCAGDASQLTDVVEIGCGNGEVFQALCDAGMPANGYAGFDISRRMLAWAQRRAGVFGYGDALVLQHQDRPPAKFVLCCEVLGHLPGAHAMLQALLKLTADDGHLLVSLWLDRVEKLEHERIRGVSFLHHVYARNQLLVQIQALAPRAQIDLVSGPHTTLLHIQPKRIAEVTEAPERPMHTVIIGSYNRPNYVRQAIASVFAQTDPDWQLIVTDDGSNAETIDAITQAFGSDPRCTLLRHEGPSEGPRPDAQYRAVHRINEALGLVRGELVHYLPDDDFYTPERFQAFRQAFQSPDVFLVYGRLSRVSADGSPPRPDIFPGGEVTKPICQLDHTQVVHRSSCLKIVPQWPTEGFYYDSDGHFFHELVQKGFGAIRPMDVVVAYHRDHGHNMIVQKEAMTSERE